MFDFRRTASSRSFVLAFLAITGVILVLFLTPERAESAPFNQTVQPCPGDLNSDLLRDMRDYVLLQSFLLKVNPLEGQALAAADVNGDERVDVLDVVALLRHRLKRSQLPDCAPVMVEGAPSIRFITPARGPEGTAFTLVGHGFSPVPSQNRVFFFRPGQTLQAPVGGGTGDRIFGVVPEGVDASRTYRVFVEVGDQESNGVGFDVRTTVPRLEIIPSSANLLLDPGSGEEVLAIGGGTRPYRLLELAEEDGDLARVELKREIIEVEGLEEGFVDIEIEDSADPPATDRASVQIMTPRFQPDFEIIPHTLLPGASPGFTLLLRNSSDNMNTVETRLEMSGVEVDLESAEEGETLGIGRQIYFGRPRGFQSIVAKTKLADAIEFEGVSLEDGGTRLGAQGEVSRAPTVFTLSRVPEPAPESVVPGSFLQEFLLGRGLFQLPETPGEKFETVATFSSSQTFEGRESRLDHMVTRELTVGEALAEGAPRIDGLVPVMGSAGQLVQIFGAGFDSKVAGNLVTFAGDENTRVEVPVEFASPSELRVRVPLEAVTGPVRVSVEGVEGNDYLFFSLFRCEAGVFFSDLTAGTGTDILLSVRQFESPRFRRVEQDLRISTVRWELRGGDLLLDSLEEGDVVGGVRVLSNTAQPQEFLLVYSGVESGEESGRREFEIREDPDSFARGRLYISRGVSGEPVLFEFPAPSFSLIGKTVEFELTGLEYVLPSTVGASIRVEGAVSSDIWNVFAERLEVTFPAEAETR